MVVGEWEEKEKDGVKEKRSGWQQTQRWWSQGFGIRNSLLFNLLRPCTTTTTTPTPPPMLSNCTTSAALWSSWNADFHPHPPPLHFSSLLRLQREGDVRGRQFPLLQAAANVNRDCVKSRTPNFWNRGIYLQWCRGILEQKCHWLTKNISLGSIKSDSTRGSIKTHRRSSADLMADSSEDHSWL